MKKTLFILLAALLLLSAVCVSAEPLSVTYYGLDKADAILITLPQGQRVLIDAGTNKDGKRLAKQFAEEGIDSLDAMIITHYDKDHVGGADQILKKLSVARVIMPQYEKDGSQYEDFLAALQKSAGTQVDLMPARQTLSLPFPGVTFTVSSAHQTYYGSDEENDFSLAARLVYGDTRFLFPGDAEDARQQELLAEGDVACDVLKLPHHGRLHSVTPAFVQAASPAIAFVPEGKDEPASPVLLMMLDDLGVEIYSSLDGDLTVLSDAERVWIDDSSEKAK